jgi:hypothetical protein
MFWSRGGKPASHRHDHADGQARFQLTGAFAEFERTRDFSHAPSPENLPKNGFCPKKGVAFLTEDVFEKKFSGAGEDSAVGAGA